MPSQSEIAEHLDMDESTVTRWCAELQIDWRTWSMDEIRWAYIRRIREQAAGRVASGGMNLAAERARLAREQADKISMQNAVTRRELAPVALIEEVLAKAGARVAAILEAIPGIVRRRVPSLSAADVEVIAVEIARARNVAAAISLDDLRDDPSPPDEAAG